MTYDYNSYIGYLLLDGIVGADATLSATAFGASDDRFSAVVSGGAPGIIYLIFRYDASKLTSQMTEEEQAIWDEAGSECLTQAGTAVALEALRCKINEALPASRQVEAGDIEDDRGYGWPNASILLEYQMGETVADWEQRVATPAIKAIDALTADSCREWIARMRP